MSKERSSTVPTIPTEIELPAPFEPAPQVTPQIIRVANELAVQRGVIAGEQRKTEDAISAVVAIEDHLHREFAHLAESVDATQRRERPPGAQRWVDWFTDKAMPQAGTNLARIAHTGAYNIGTVVARSLVQEEPEPLPPPQRGFFEQLFGRRGER